MPVMNSSFRLLSVALILAPFTALTQSVTVQFSGHASRSDVFLNAPMTGYFTYNLQQGLNQVSTRPIFAIEIPGYQSLRMNSYQISVWDNRMSYDGSPTLDGLVLQFGHPSLDSGAGSLQLLSSDLSLFSGTSFPTSLPSMERFDFARGLGYHRDFGNIAEPGNYWAVAASFDQITVVPEPGIGWLAGGMFLIGYWFCRASRRAASGPPA
jgi:hypothetical protein